MSWEDPRGPLTEQLERSTLAMTVQELNQTQPRDWNPDRETIARLLNAVNREAYPPAQRGGVGPAVKTAG